MLLMRPWNNAEPSSETPFRSLGGDEVDRFKSSLTYQLTLTHRFAAFSLLEL